MLQYLYFDFQSFGIDSDPVTSLAAYLDFIVSGDMLKNWLHFKKNCKRYYFTYSVPARKRLQLCPRFFAARKAKWEEREKLNGTN